MTETSPLPEPPNPPESLIKRAFSMPFLARGWLFCLFLLWLLSPVVGERNPAVATTLFVWPLFWIAPVIVLLPVRSIRQRKWLWRMLAGSIIFHTVFFMNLRFHPGSSRPAQDQSLCVVTYNRGEEGKTSPAGFISEVNAGIVVIQDAKGRAARYQRDSAFAAFTHARDIGEFAILSKYPVLNAELVGQSQVPPAGSAPLAARFEVDFMGTKIAIFAVHLMTPRRELVSYRRGAPLYGVLGLIPGTPWKAKSAKMQEFWDARIADLETVLSAVRSDPLPAVLAGDMNLVDRGWCYRQVAKELTDCHAECGTGYGFSMPGTTMNPLALFRPWLRIDYIWAAKSWQVLHCETETDRESQHMAVAAWLKLSAGR